MFANFHFHRVFITVHFSPLHFFQSPNIPLIGDAIFYRQFIHIRNTYVAVSSGIWIYIKNKIKFFDYAKLIFLWTSLFILRLVNDNDKPTHLCGPRTKNSDVTKNVLNSAAETIFGGKKKIRSRKRLHKYVQYIVFEGSIGNTTRHLC